MRPRASHVPVLCLSFPSRVLSSLSACTAPSAMGPGGATIAEITTASSPPQHSHRPLLRGQGPGRNPARRSQSRPASPPDSFWGIYHHSPLAELGGILAPVESMEIITPYVFRPEFSQHSASLQIRAAGNPKAQNQQPALKPWHGLWCGAPDPRAPCSVSGAE